jgi:hypothetical protein
MRLTIGKASRLRLVRGKPERWLSALPTSRASQLLALGVGKPLPSTHAVIPSATPTIDRIGKALESLALAASNNTTVLQQLSTANLAFTVLVTSLTAANKKLMDALACNKGGAVLATPATLAAAPAPGKAPCLATRPFLGNYCWTHGHKVNQTHTSATCTCRVAGHKEDATTANTLGSSKADKGWNSCA